VLEDFGSIGILVNNAGIASRGQSVADTDPAEMERVVRVHAFGPHYLCKLVIPHMRKEKRGDIAGKVVTFVGDGDSNTARSWLFAADKLGFELRIAAPKRYQPNQSVLQRAGRQVRCMEDLQEAARGADVLYTDIWVSMGKEGEEARRQAELGPYWINQALVRQAKPDALVMHCLPAHRGQEIEDAVLEGNAETIFDQAENRLHVQKAILTELVR